MRLANGYDVFPTASIMGQFLHPSPSQGDYRFSMRILNKHTEPPFCHYGFCPAIHISPLFCQPQSCLPLLVISISKLCTHLQTYLNLSILILYLPISKLSAYNSYLSLLLCPSLPPSLPSYFSVLVILPKLQCPPLFSPYDDFKSRKNSAQKLNYSLER